MAAETNQLSAVASSDHRNTGGPEEPGEEFLQAWCRFICRLVAGFLTRSFPLSGAER